MTAGDEMSEFARQVERQVLRTRALCAEDQRDEWKARAEKAEALLREIAPTLNKLASRATYMERDDAIGLDVVRLDVPIGIAKEAFAKVRALLKLRRPSAVK